MSKVRIPVRINSSSAVRSFPEARADVSVRGPAVTERMARESDVIRNSTRQATGSPFKSQPVLGTAKTSSSANNPRPCESDGASEAWRDRALRLQAEMENFRKRQMRLSHDRVQSDRERLLRSFLEVADDIARALEFKVSESDDSLREGVRLTHRRLMGILDREGVVSVEAIGKPFDPTVHEAVGTVPGELAASPPDTVVEVVREGYMFNGRLLRPARVVVAT